MTEGDLDYLGHDDWRKRIHQLKKELRSAPSEPSRTIPEQPKAYGTELKPKRILPNGKPTRSTPEIASAPPR